jgi:DNA-directed RNA polymerase sigma subunit (sigma70/sigma32)
MKLIEKKIDPDLDLVRRAKRNDSLAKNALIRKYAPMLRIKVNAYSKAPIPYAALEGQAMQLLLHAVDKFDPKQGVQLKTFMEHNLKGLYRYSARHKNMARIPEHRALQYTRFTNIKSILASDKGREPSNDELGEALGWSPTQVQKMEQTIGRREIAMSGIETLHEQERLQDKIEDILEFEYFGLTPEEKQVYDYSLGRHGKPRIARVEDISKRTGISTDKIYKIKQKLAVRVSRRL